MVVYLDNGCLFMNEAQMILLTVWICFERFWVGLDGPVRWSSAQTRLAGWGLTPGLIMLIHHMISKYSGYNRIYTYINIQIMYSDVFSIHIYNQVQLWKFLAVATTVVLRCTATSKIIEGPAWWHGGGFVRQRSARGCWKVLMER